MGCASSVNASVEETCSAKKPTLHVQPADPMPEEVNLYKTSLVNIFFVLSGGPNPAANIKEHMVVFKEWFPDVHVIDYEQFKRAEAVMNAVKASVTHAVVEDIHLVQEDKYKVVDQVLSQLLVHEIRTTCPPSSRVCVLNYPTTPQEYFAFEQAIAIEPYEGDETDKDPTIREAARRRSLAAEAQGFPATVNFQRAFILDCDDAQSLAPISHLLGRRGVLRRIPAFVVPRAVNLMFQSASKLFTDGSRTDVFFVNGAPLNNVDMLAEKLCESMDLPLINFPTLPGCEAAQLPGNPVHPETAVKAILAALPEGQHTNVIVYGFPQSAAQWDAWQNHALARTVVRGIILAHNTAFDPVATDKVEDIEAYVHRQLATAEAAIGKDDIIGDAAVLGHTLASRALYRMGDTAAAALIAYASASRALMQRIHEEPSLIILPHAGGCAALLRWMDKALTSIGCAPMDGGPPQLTYAMIKPDATATESTSAILRRARECGFEVVLDQLRALTGEDAARFYREHQGKAFYNNLLDFMGSGPVTALILRASGAVGRWRRLAGPTNSYKARLLCPDSLRAIYGTDGSRNAVHGSDSVASANREIQLIFPNFPQEHRNPDPAPPRILLAGGPASGKGTQAELLRDTLGVVHISTGELLRNEKAKGSALGLKAAQYFENGKLVPDSVMIPLVIDRVKEEDCVKHGFMLDGFPRTPEQARALKNAGLEADVFVLVDVSDEMLVRRVAGRRMCKKTGKIYHMEFNPPPAEMDPEDLEQRADDTEEKVRGRIATFKQHVVSIAEEFGAQLCVIGGERNKHAVFEDIKTFL